MSTAYFKETEEYGRVLIGQTADKRTVAIRHRTGVFNFSWLGNNYGVDVPVEKWEDFINFGCWTMGQLKDKLYQW